MAIADDIAIDGSGNIYYTGAVHGAAGAGYYTVIELHRYLQDLADDASASGDDLIDITSETPSDRSTDNIITVLAGFRLDDANVSATDPISEHLFDGSIIQADDDSIWDGLVVIAAEGMDLQILQNGGVVANDFWNTVPNGQSTKGLNRDAANGISHRFMLKVRDAGADTDGRRIVGITREVGKTYSEFRVNGTARGNNVLALTFADDLNNQTAAGTIATWTTITNTEGFRNIDIDGNGTPENYYSEWNRDTFSINQFYERMKWLTACESGTSAGTANGTLYGLAGNLFRGITHEVSVASTTGIVEGTSATFSNGATAQVLAVETDTRIFVQVLTGVIPSSGTVDGQTVTGSSEVTVSAPFIGSSTGSALIGAFGVGLETADTSASDLFTDLDGATNQPPNNVTFTVGGLVSGEDRVLVGPANGGNLNTIQGQLAGGPYTGGEGTVTIASNNEALGNGTPSAVDTPASGTIRVLGDDGVYARVTYTSRQPDAGEMVFLGCVGMPAAANTNAAFISYVDELAGGTSAAFTVVYDSDRSLFVRVRDGGTAGDAQGIKTFETPGTLGSSGGSTTAIRTSDA